MRILSSYILRLHLVPFLLGFGVVTFVFEMDYLFQYLDLVLNRGVPVLVVGKVFLLSLGFVVAMSVPCAVLVAELMTFGRLSQDNEITALRASGVHMFSIIGPPLAVSVLLALGLTYFNNRIYPEANHALMNLMIDIGRMRPTVRLQEGVFITDFPGYNMLVKSVNGQTNEMRGITIYQFNAGSPPTTILAERGRLTYTPDGQTAVLELEDGEIHEVPLEAEGARRYHRLAFRKHNLYMEGAGSMLEGQIRTSRTDREKGAGLLLAERDSVRAMYRSAVTQRTQRLRQAGVPEQALRALDPDRAPLATKLAGLVARLAKRPDPFAEFARAYPNLAVEAEMGRMEREALLKRQAGLSVEIHKKFALPVACIVFVLIGAPIGMRVKRAGPAVAFLSIGFFIFYYVCLVGGEELANRLLMPPWLAMWLANIIVGLIGVERTLDACDVPLPWRRRRPVPGPAAALPAPVAAAAS